ncbi:MAG: UvrD-helicase domain-containing protein, partial [Jatrophihabitans sp.]
MSDAAQFDLLAELPQGTTVLEASAGTGKTFTIAGLVTRYVAEGVARLDQLLVVTFGRAATQELRDRVRERLVRARDALVDPAAALAGDDALLRHLASADVVARRDRLVRALSEFDSATVATTHEFCSRVLAGLGTAADVDASASFVENLDDLTEEVVADLYLQMWARPNATDPPLTYDEAITLAHTVIRDGQALLVPETPAVDSPADLRRRFATAVREQVEHRKRARLLLSYDDLLTRLRATLADGDTGAAAAGRLRSRYRVVLVDEFQDTDPVQWDILRLAFHGHSALVLIGDPKQAIYAFRGADVHAYLAAKDAAAQHATLARNWRSDPVLLAGLDALMGTAALGDPRIVVQPVSAAHEGRSLSSSAAPVRIRVVRADPSQSVAQARAMVVPDVVAEVVGLLEGGAKLTPRDGGPVRGVRPGDIAIIVDTNAQLDLVHDALQAASVPSVRRTTSSVFRTPAGSDWVVLLEALEQPSRTTLLRRLAITPFVGWDAADLESKDLDGLALRLRHWVTVFQERGIAALLETISRNEMLQPRLLAQVDGERRLTDLRHVGEALHSAAMTNRFGLAAVSEWLRRRVKEAHRDTAVERSRRLDSDAAAVQIVTVWASKGLEFPIVLVPFEWDRFVRDEAVPLFHDDAGRRVRDVGGHNTPTIRDSQRRGKSEQRGEELRLLYVALTRAQAQVVAWWAPSGRNTECAPLHRLLFCDDPSVEIPERVPVPNEARAVERLMPRAVPGRLAIEPVEPREPGRWVGAAYDAGSLDVARLHRGIDTEWRRTSYSALTAAAHDAGPSIASEAEVQQKDDEPDVPTAVNAERDALQAVPSPMSDLPGGTSFGTLVHSVLEHLDTTAADFEGEVLAQVREALARFGPDHLDAEELAAGLLPSLCTPLGALADGYTLAEIAPADRLAELDFELPLRGGDAPNGTTILRDIAQLLRDWLPANDPLTEYAAMLEEPVLGAAA